MSEGVAASTTPGPSSTLKAATSEDFDRFITTCDADDGWEVAKETESCRVCTRREEGSAVMCVRITSEFSVPPGDLYDALMDPNYRSSWDESCTVLTTVERVQGRNDEVSYYAAKLPTPLADRDWVLQCAAAIRPSGDMAIFSRSVAHPSCPEKKNYVRATSRIGGYLMRPVQADERRCSFTYISHNEWNGSIPSWIVNWAMKTMAPSVLEKLQKAAEGYPAWKATHSPEDKPWRSSPSL